MKGEIKTPKRDPLGELVWDIGLELLSQGKLMRFRARGGSMSPLICDGQVVVIRPCQAEGVKFGDIILCYRLDGRYWNVSGGNKVKGRQVIHRFLWRKNIDGQKVLITKGDANRNYDQPVLADQVLGKVVVVEKKGWKIRLDTKIGRLLNIFFAAISPFSFLIYPSLRLVKRTVRLRKYIKIISVHGSVADFESDPG